MNEDINPNNWIVIERYDSIFFFFLVHYFWVLIPLNTFVIGILFILTECNIHIYFDIDARRGTRRRAIREMSRILKKQESKLLNKATNLSALLQIQGGADNMFDILSRCIKDNYIYVVKSKKLAKSIKKLFK
jgi:hypothetical protein